MVKKLMLRDRRSCRGETVDYRCYLLNQLGNERPGRRVFSSRKMSILQTGSSS